MSESEDVEFKELTHNDFDYITLSADKCVVIFTAPWCSPCKMIKPMIPAIAQEYGVSSFWVNIEKNMDIASQFKIQAVPFIATMKNGTVVESVATNNIQKISEMISRL